MADPAYIDPDTNVLTDGEAWVGLNTTTLGSDTATVTFKSGFDDTDTDVGGVQAWDQYMDLVIVSYARGAVAVVTAQLDMQLNADTGSNYAKQRIEGSGSAAYAASWGSATSHMLGVLPCANATANVFVSSVTSLFDINSGKYKSGLSQTTCDKNGSGAVEMMGLTWKSQAPITEIDLFGQSAADLLTGSRFDLFGILPRMVS